VSAEVIADGGDESMVAGLRDTGRRVEFAGGAQREMTPGKGRFDLLSPIAIQTVARIMEAGATKYKPRNWEKGLPLSSFLDSGLRHLFQLLEGDEVEDHAGQAAWNILGFIHTREMIRRGVLPPELDDMPSPYVEPKGEASGE